MDLVDESSITKADAKRAGYESVDSLLRADTYAALARACTASASDQSLRPTRGRTRVAGRVVRRRMSTRSLAGSTRLDRAASHGPWTSDVLAMHRRGTRSAGAGLRSTIRPRGAALQARRSQAQRARTHDQLARRLPAVASRRGLLARDGTRGSGKPAAPRPIERREGPRRRNAGPAARVVRSIGPDTPIAATTAPLRSRTGALTEATPGSRSSTLSTHPGPSGVSPRSTRPADPAVSGSAAPTATMVRSPCGEVERLDADAVVAVADVELRALLGLVAQLRQRRTCELRERCAVERSPPERRQSEPEREAAVAVAADQLVHLERDCEAVGGGAGQARWRRRARPRFLGPSASAASTSTALSRTPTPLTLRSTSRD